MSAYQVMLLSAEVKHQQALNIEKNLVYAELCFQEVFMVRHVDVGKCSRARCSTGGCSVLR